MVEKANKKMATMSTQVNQGKISPNAAEVSSDPSRPRGLVSNPVKINTKAVMVQTTTVSMNGSSKETTPSLTGYFVREAECAIDADPTPASFENAALWKPTMSTPMIPPFSAEGLNAPW